MMMMMMKEEKGRERESEEFCAVVIFLRKNPAVIGVNGRHKEYSDTCGSLSHP